MPICRSTQVSTQGSKTPPTKREINPSPASGRPVSPVRQNASPGRSDVAMSGEGPKWHMPSSMVNGGVEADGICGWDMW